MINTFIGVLATAGVAFVLSVVSALLLAAMGFSKLVIVPVVCLILLVGIMAAVTWDALDNAYTKWWRARFDI